MFSAGLRSFEGNSQLYAAEARQQPPEGRRRGRVTFIVKLIQGTPPNFRQLIPTEPPLKVQVFAPDLERAVRRLREIAEDSKGIIRFTWTESAMTLSAKSDEKGSVEAEVPVKAEGGTGRVALNAGYLLEYLKGREGLVTMGTTDERSPVLFRHGTSPLVVIMPLGVQWEPKPAVVAEAEQVVEQAEAAIEEVEPDAEEPEVVSEDKPKRKRKPKG